MANINFFANGLCLICHLAKNELAEFLQYHTSSEESWSRQNATLQSELESILAKYPKEEHADIVEYHAWDLHQNQFKFPNIHRESVLITIYNFLESELNKLCGVISDSIDNPIHLKDLQGKGIERALLFLTKVAGFDCSSMGKELPYVKNVNLLRNQIVHNGGILPTDGSHKLNLFVESNQNLSGQPGSAVRLSSEFVSEFIENLNGFLGKLEKEVQCFMARVNAQPGSQEGLRE
jgi:hypothetical protein